MNRHEIGSWAESAACQHLKANGWTIVDRNVRLGCGEIDIVARRQDVTAFVEVKSRSSDRFGTPAEAVNANTSQSNSASGESITICGL